LPGAQAWPNEADDRKRQLRSANPRYLRMVVIHSVFHTSMERSRHFQPMIERDAV
jgi:hypothetical protein